MSTWKGAVPGADAQFVAKRQAILREAAASFNRKGYHGTSLTDIAETLDELAEVERRCVERLRALTRGRSAR